MSLFACVLFEKSKLFVARGAAFYLLGSLGRRELQVSHPRTVEGIGPAGLLAVCDSLVWCRLEGAEGPPIAGVYTSSSRQQKRTKAYVWYSTIILYIVSPY